MKFNEDSRVKILALIHLTRLGYKYLSLKQAKWDIDTNIFPEVFKEVIEKKFEDISTPIIQKRQNLLKENQRLSELRDWLLPMLMNGQVKG